MENKSRLAFALFGLLFLFAPLVLAVDPYVSFVKTASPSSVAMGDNITITINATGGGDPLVITKPADVMLVVDRSGSMADSITNTIVINQTSGTITTQSVFTVVQTFSVSPQSAFDVIIAASGTGHAYDLRIQKPDGTNFTKNDIKDASYTKSFTSADWQAGTWKVWMSNRKADDLTYQVTSQKTTTTTKIDAAKAAADTFVDVLNETAQGGLTSFSTTATLDKQLALMTAANKTALKNTIDALASNGWTAFGLGINTTTAELTSVRARSGAIKFMVFMSDGQNNCGGTCTEGSSTAQQDAYSAAQNAANHNITIYTIGFGSDADNATLQHIASMTGGSYYYAADAETLRQIYEDIATQINNIAATSLQVTDILSSPAVWIGPLPSGCSYNDVTKTLSCYSGSLALNSSWVIQFNIVLNGTGSLWTNDNASSYSYTAANGSTQSGLLTSPVVVVGSGCNYTAWVDDVCVANGTMRQTRTDNSGYPYCTELEQNVPNQVCGCQQNDTVLECVSDGYRQHRYTWNYGYCGANYFGNVTDSTCDCVASESSRTCVSDGFANVTYTWNHDYCEAGYTQTEVDSNCESNYSCTNWTNVDNQYDGCIGNGTANQSRTCTDQYQNSYVEYNTTGDANCNCVASGGDRTCVSDGYANVTYVWNYGYCGEGYTQTEADSNCASNYSCTNWTNVENQYGSCIENGYANQTRTCIDQYQNSYDEFRTVNDTNCNCLASEDSRTCVSDGYTNVTYGWNYGYCDEGYTLTETDSNCSCQYTNFTDTECVANGTMQQTRQRTSEFEYCTDLTRNVSDSQCGCRLSYSLLNCTSDGFGLHGYSWNYNYCDENYTLEETDLNCSSNYSCGDWTPVENQYNGCIEEGIVNLTRTCTDQYQNSYVNYTTNTSENCLCQYTNWTNTGCVALDSMHQSRANNSVFEYCTDLSRNVPDETCACTPGDTRTQPDSCLYGGYQSSTCGENYQWGDWSACQNEGQCAPNSTETQSCGNGGSQTRTCLENYVWGSWGDCVGEVVYVGGYYGGYSAPETSPTPKPTQTPAPTSIAPPAPSPSPSPRPTMGHLALTIPSPQPSALPLGEQPAAITGLFAFANSSCVGALLLLAIIASALAYYASQKKKIVKAPLWIALAVMFLLPFAAALLLNDACQAVAYAVGEDVILALLAFAVRKGML